MSAQNAAVAQPATNEAPVMTEEQRKFITENPQIVIDAANKAIRRYQIRKAVVTVGVVGVIGLIAYGAFRLKKAAG